MGFCTASGEKHLGISRVQDFDLADVILQPGETTGKMYASRERILQLLHSGQMVPYDYLETVFQAAGMS